MTEGDVLKIGGYIKTLESGAKVFVGVGPKEDPAVYLTFTNQEGIETKLCLSLQAMSALCELWSQIAISRPSAWTVEVSKQGEMICTHEESNR